MGRKKVWLGFFLVLGGCSSSSQSRGVYPFHSGKPESEVEEKVANVIYSDMAREIKGVPAGIWLTWVEWLEWGPHEENGIVRVKYELRTPKKEVEMIDILLSPPTMKSNPGWVTRRNPYGRDWMSYLNEEKPVQRSLFIWKWRK